MATGSGDANVDDLAFSEVIAVSSSSAEDQQFDTVIGHMEDIIIDERFRQLQTTFMEEHYREFDDSEENKFSYTDIFRAYNTLLENFIQESLIQRLPNFSMADFIRQLQMRRDELDGEVFEILLSFSDFLAFKEAILDFKSAKEGRTVDLSSGISITSSNHGVPSMDELCNNSPGSFN